MASGTFDQVCGAIYSQISQRLERKESDSLRFAPLGTAEIVLDAENLRKFYRSLAVSIQAANSTLHLRITEDVFVEQVQQKKLQDFLAVIILSACSLAAAVAFVNELAGAHSPKVLNDPSTRLPVTWQGLVDLFDNEVDVDKFYSKQGCFCTVVLRNREEVRIDSLDNRRLPFLDEKRIGEGSFGKIYKVRIAKGHFYDGSKPGFERNVSPFEVARKDYEMSKGHSAKGEREIMEKILSSTSRKCENIVENLGSLAIGDTYSLFMPLATCDLRAYMMEGHRTRPNTTKAKAELIRCAEGLASGLDFLHFQIKTTDLETLMCYHMDLTPRNILIFWKESEQRNIWKLSDFGMSSVKIKHCGQVTERESDFNGLFIRHQKHKDPSFSATENRRQEGTYLAPESIRSTKAMTRKSDVWSLGCIISILFTYLEDGGDGVENYGKFRLERDRSCDRFFVRDNFSFKPVSNNPAVEKWHHQLVTKARHRHLEEGDTVRRVLKYLETFVLRLDRDSRCEARSVMEMLGEAFNDYSKLSQIRDSQERQRESSSAVIPFKKSLFKRADVGGKAGQARGQDVSRWTIMSPERLNLKGCAISPDASLVAYWTDSKILLHSAESLPQPHDSSSEVESPPSATFTLSHKDKIWSSVDLTQDYLAACVAGTSECYIFDLQDGHSVDVNLKTHRVVQLCVSEINKIAISPNGKHIACVVKRDPAHPQASILHVTTRMLNDSDAKSLDESSWDATETEWAASDITNLYISNNLDIYFVVRPELTVQTHEHKIPLCCISLQDRVIRTVNLKSMGFDSSGSRSFFTACCTFGVGACAAITREKRLHVLHFSPGDTGDDVQKDIPNYRILRVICQRPGGSLFALGTTSTTHRVLLLNISVPLRGEKLNIREITPIPDLSYGDEFVMMLSGQGAAGYVLVAALVGSNRRSIYRIAVPEGENGN